MSQQFPCELQDGFLRGPPPLGPGAPPRERLLAFFSALSRLLDEHGDLIAEAQRTKPAGTPFGGGPYGAYHTHVRILLRELGPELDIGVLAHVLLAPFRAELLRPPRRRHPRSGPRAAAGRARDAPRRPGLKLCPKCETIVRGRR